MSDYISVQFDYDDNISISIFGSTAEVASFLDTRTRGKSHLPIEITTANEEPVEPSAAFWTQLQQAQAFLQDPSSAQRPQNIQTDVILLDESLVPFRQLLPPDVQQYIDIMKPAKDAPDVPVYIQPETWAEWQQTSQPFADPSDELRGKRALVKSLMGKYLQARYNIPRQSRYPQFHMQDTPANLIADGPSDILRSAFDADGPDSPGVRDAFAPVTPRILSACIREKRPGELCHRYKGWASAGFRFEHLWCFNLGNSTGELVISVASGAGTFTVYRGSDVTQAIAGTPIEIKPDSNSPFSRDLSRLPSRTPISVHVTGAFCDYQFGRECPDSGIIE